LARISGSVELGVELDIESVDLDANGIARREGKVIFVRGALPGERVNAHIVRRKASYEVAQTDTVIRASSQRVTPKCPNFGVCGGCSMQHLEERSQLAIKQRVLEDQLKHLGGMKAETMLRPIAGVGWRYRYRARLSVRNVEKKGGVLIGFHERASRYVTDMTECHVLPEHLSDLLVPLRALIGSLSIKDQTPQIEIAQGEGVLALVFRVLRAPSSSDLNKLRQFEQRHDLEIWLQAKGPETIVLLEAEREPGLDDNAVLEPRKSRLSYSLPEFGIRMPFRPTDFTQVNHLINRVLVKRAIDLLAPERGERIADLFCGLGNFTLPIGRMGADVLGIEGSAELVNRARTNALANSLERRCLFSSRNLFTMTPAEWLALGHFDRLLIDPPREGAAELVKAITQTDAHPKRIVYVSCNPATLARDAAILVHQGPYVLSSAGVINMFPHTSHVESIAVFDLK
jgi:23S rRNA (uracil1939-C5)-methyltransferase